MTHDQALEVIREFLNAQSSYDVFPVSFRLIVLDSELVVKKALGVMMQNGKTPGLAVIRLALFRRIRGLGAFKHGGMPYLILLTPIPFFPLRSTI